MCNTIVTWTIAYPSLRMTYLVRHLKAGLLSSLRRMN